MYGLFAVACLIGVSAGAPNDLGPLPISLDYAHDKISVPHYNFHYAVNDPHTGDNKAQSESRDGGGVKGSYSLTEPDGTLRVVDYKADPVSGFHADVKRIGPAVDHQKIIAAPVKLELGLTPIGLGYGYGGYGKAGLGLGLGYGGYDKAGAGLGLGYGGYDKVNLGLGIGYGPYDKASLGLGLGYGSYGKASLGLGLGYGDYDKADLGIGLGYGGYNKAGSLGYGGYDKAGLGLGLGYGGYDKVGLGLTHGYAGLGLGGLKGAWSMPQPHYDSKY